MGEKKYKHNQFLKDLFSEIEPSIFDPELARMIADSLKNEETDCKKPMGLVIIIPRQRLHISKETLAAYTEDLQSIQTTIIAEKMQSDMADECTGEEGNVQDEQDAGAESIKKADEKSDAFEMVEDESREDENLEDNNREDFDCSQNIEGVIDAAEDDEGGDKTETGDIIETDDGDKKEEFFTIHYLNPEKPENGVMYIVAKLTLEEIIMVARFQWVARLEMPREYYAELKG